MAATQSESVRVWDPFVRVFHWSLLASFMGAYFATEEGDLVHQVLGYIALGLVVARIVWGFVGTRYARFASFVPTPHALFAYLTAMLARREPRYLGHNPAGGVMVIALLAAVVASSVTGWLLLTDAFWGDESMEEAHEVLSALTLALVGFHVAGVVYESVRHRENLVLAMLTGRKRADGDPS